MILNKKTVFQEDIIECQDLEDAIPEFENAASVIEKCLVYHLSGFVVKKL